MAYPGKLRCCGVFSSFVWNLCWLTSSPTTPPFTPRAQDLENDALRRELFKDHMDTLKRRRAGV